MSANFLELDVADPVIPFYGTDVESHEIVSLPLPIPVVSVSNVVLIETRVQIVATKTRVPIVPIKTTIVTGDIVGSHANDMLDPPTMNENAQPVEQVPLRRTTR